MAKEVEKKAVDPNAPSEIKLEHGCDNRNKVAVAEHSPVAEKVSKK